MSGEQLRAQETVQINHQLSNGIGREIGVTEDGEWMIVVHRETAADSAASIAKFGEARGVETFMAFLVAETMVNTAYDIQQ